MSVRSLPNMPLNEQHPARQIPSLTGDLLRIDDARLPAAASAIALDALYGGYLMGQRDAMASLMTTQDMADALGVNQQRVRALARAREVGWQIGRDRLFVRADVERMRPGKPGRPKRNANDGSSAAG